MSSKAWAIWERGPRPRPRPKWKNGHSVGSRFVAPGMITDWVSCSTGERVVRLGISDVAWEGIAAVVPTQSDAVFYPHALEKSRKKLTGLGVAVSAMSLEGIPPRPMGL